MPPLRDRLFDGLRARVVAALSARAADLAPLADDRAALARRITTLQARTDAISEQLDRLQAEARLATRPFSADMTIDEAWRRHPGAARVFARHHLPACDGCAVRFDETVEEAASAYGLDLPTLLGELSALLQPPADRPPDAGL